VQRVRVSPEGALVVGARSDIGTARAAVVSAGGRVEQVDLQPEQVEGLQRPGDPDAALRLEVEAEIDDRPGGAPGA
jgi:hypothetical protein